MKYEQKSCPEKKCKEVRSNKKRREDIRRNEIKKTKEIQLRRSPVLQLNGDWMI
ncbi:hypothetical protein [Paenibacillus sp. Z6-24]